jgi:hypothetical protein
MVDMNNQIYLNGITIEQLAEALKFLMENPTSKQEPQLENDFITREEVCKLLSINMTSLWKHTKSGRLKSYGIGNRVLYKKAKF